MTVRDREEAKEIIKGYTEDYLRSKGINTGAPFTCLNPDHADKHPSMSYDRKHNFCKCFSCGATYDIFNLIGIDYGLTDNAAIFKKAYELYNISVGDLQTKAPERKAAEPGQDKNFASYYTQILPNITEEPVQNYLHSRGISNETAKRYSLCYEPKFKTFNETEKGRTSVYWRALIIPTSKGSFIARNIDKPEEPTSKNRYRKEGASMLFNSKALYTSDKPIFITEGELDAISIYEAGGQAVGLGSTSNYKKLTELVKKQKPTQALILALDADEEGRKAEDKLAAELEALQVPFYRYNPYGASKDANEALLIDREAFTSELRTAEHLQEAELEAQKEALLEEYQKESAAYYVADFLNGISEAVNTPAISTGFSNLDKALDGGLYEGLYIIGAVSSLGKTTLALQIMDNIAQSGRDVLIFSLEMARSELLAKSISRHTYLLAESRQDAKTTRGITAGSRYKNYNNTEKEIINSAVEAYKAYADHIYIHEGIGNIGIDEVKEIVKKHIAIKGSSPVVLIDYLQILAPYDMRASDKQNTDKAVLELKRLSRDYKIPVIGISSFNRDSYKLPVDNSSFKESGAIEYSADVLIGLQYNGMDYQEGESTPAREKRIRELWKKQTEKGKKGEAQELQAKILKSRNGSKGFVYFNFFAMFNCFKGIEGTISQFDGFQDAESADDPFKDIRK